MTRAMTNHAYAEGRNGRRMIKKPHMPAGKVGTVATCSECGLEAMLLHAIGSEELLDKNFQRKGWRMDKKPICPNCQERKPKNMATVPSANAIRGQVHLVKLLTEHFDVEAGQYDDGWSDQKLADETKLSLDYVTNFRREGFGEIKEPEALSQLRQDINALEALQADASATFAQQIAELRSKLAMVTQKFAA